MFENGSYAHFYYDKSVYSVLFFFLFWRRNALTVCVFFIFYFHIFSAVAKDKDKQSFKLRAGMDKKIVIYVQQTCNKELAIER